MSLYPLSNTWDTKYVTVSNTWAIKDTVTSYLTKYTLCSVGSTHIMIMTDNKMFQKAAETLLENSRRRAFIYAWQEM